MKGGESLVLNQASNIMYGEIEVQRVYQGSVLVWERKKGVDKIAVILLDALFTPTTNISYFSRIYDAVSFMKNNIENNYAVIIGEKSGVTSIDRGAFRSVENMIRITVPEIVETIGAEAFYGCTALQEIILNNKLTILNDDLFRNCSSLPQLRIPETVEEIGEEVFYNCSNLSQILIGENIPEDNATIFTSTLKRIGVFAFYGTALTSVILPETTVEFPKRKSSSENTNANGVFSNCECLVSAVLPDIKPFVGDNMFLNCTRLKSVTFGENAAPEKIGNFAFKGCESLTDINAPDSIQRIGNEAFKDCFSLRGLRIPLGVRTMGYRAFENCHKLVAMTFPPNTTKFLWSSLYGTHSNMFYGCENLWDVTMQNREEAFDMEGYTFWDLNPFDAPNFVKLLRDKETKVPELKTVIKLVGGGSVLEENGTYSNAGLIAQLDENNISQAYSTETDFGSVRRTLENSPENTYSVELGSTFGQKNILDKHVILEKYFSGLENLKSITIPECFYEIEENAFAGCTNLEEIDILRKKSDDMHPPWGAPAGTKVRFLAYLCTTEGEIMTVISKSSVTGLPTGSHLFALSDGEPEFQTGLSGISLESELPEEETQDTLYIIQRKSIFDMTLNGKKLKG